MTTKSSRDNKGTNKKQARDEFDYGSGDDGDESDSDAAAPINAYNNVFWAPVPVPDAFAAAGIDGDNADINDTDSVFETICVWTRAVILDETIQQREASVYRILPQISCSKPGPKTFLEKLCDP